MATITGTAGNDIIKGTTGADEMSGLSGNDTYTVNHCDDEVVEAPGGGTDTVVASHLFKLSDNVENLTITGTAATDGYGNAENNVITGNSGPNLLVTGAGIDTVNGGDGNDVLVLGANLTAADMLNGGKGIDAVRLDGDYAAGVVFTANTMVNVEQIALADGNDYKLTLVDANNISSLIVDGSLLTGTNTLTVDASLETASGITALGGEGDDTLTGGSGADSFTGGKGADIITGGLGVDTVNYDGSATGVTVDLNSAAAQTGGDAAGDKLSGVENVVGSAVHDTLTGTAGNNRLSGAAGNDTITSGAGDDVVLAGDGDDALIFGANLAKTDFIEGGDGEDSLSIAGNYAAGFTFDAARFKNLESVELGAGFDYKLVLTDGANAVGFAVDGSALGAGEDLNLSGAAETFAPLVATGGAGNDTLVSGGGNDILTAGAGVDILTANKGDDIFVMKGNLTAVDRIDGGAGNDKLVLDGDYSAGLTFSTTTAINLESIVVTDGNDYKLTLDNATNSKSLLVDGRALTAGSELNFNGAAETTNTFTLFGGAGADTLTGGAGNDTLNAGEGNDTIATGASAGIDFVLAGGGNDLIAVDAFLTSAERIDGGLGNDTLVFDGDYSGGIVFTTTTVTNIEKILLEDSGSYKLTLNDATVAANAVLTVDASQLTGSNALNFNGAPEKSSSLILLGGEGDDTLTGGGGIDAIGGSLGADVVNGGGNVDVLSYENSLAGVTIDLTLAGAQGGGGDGAGDVISNIENLIGSALDDDLTGDALANTIVGGAGKDTIDGGGGIDTVSYIGSDAGVNVDLTEILQGGVGHAAGDELTNVENVTGSALGDHITGDGGNNVLDGAGGSDLLIGGAGNDTMTGGSGVDTFGWLDTIAGKDTITDFDSGTDILDISDLLSGFDPLTSDANDFVRFLQSAGNTIVQLDVNGTTSGSDFVTLVTLKSVTGTVDGFVGNGSLDLT